MPATSQTAAEQIHAGYLQSCTPCSFPAQPGSVCTIAADKAAWGTHACMPLHCRLSIPCSYKPAPQATLKLGQQLRKQEFRLHSPNPRMLPREFVPERLDVDCSLKTPLKAPEEAAPAGRGGSKRGRGGAPMLESASTAVIAPHALQQCMSSEGAWPACQPSMPGSASWRPLCVSRTTFQCQPISLSMHPPHPAHFACVCKTQPEPQDSPALPGTQTPI